MERGCEFLEAVVLEGRKGLRGSPDKWGAFLAPLANWYVSVSQTERAAFREGVEVAQGAILRGISLQLCAAAARSGEEKYLRDSLMCHVLEDFKRDERENARLLAAVQHVAEQIGVDPERLFKEAMAVSGGRARSCFQEFLDRPNEMKTLETMRLEEVQTPRGVSYREKKVPFPKW